MPGGADRSYGIHVGAAGRAAAAGGAAGERDPERAGSVVGQAVRISPHGAQQVALFPETSPLLDELEAIDVNALSPIEALNKLFEWQRKYVEKDG